MQARRYAGHCVLAIGAVASIATGRAGNWILTTDVTIERTAVAAGPSIGFAITGEARGPADGHYGGDLTLHLQLELTNSNLPMASVRVVFASEDGDPDRRHDLSVLVSPGDPVELELPVLAWGDCSADPCFDDFRLTISEVQPGAEITVSGTVGAVLRGLDSQQEPNSAVVVEVTPLGMVP
jgi:hypothetical protein